MVRKTVPAPRPIEPGDLLAALEFAGCESADTVRPTTRGLVEELAGLKELTALPGHPVDGRLADPGDPRRRRDGFRGSATLGRHPDDVGTSVPSIVD